MSSDKNEDFVADIEANGAATSESSTTDPSCSATSSHESNSALEQHQTIGMASVAADIPFSSLWGVELVEDEGVPDPPFAEIEAILDASKESDQDGSTMTSALAGVKYVAVDDDGPDPPVSVAAEFLESEAAGKYTKIARPDVGVELIEDDDDGNFNALNAMVEQHDQKIRKEKANQASIATPYEDEESILVPTEEEMADGVGSYRNRDNDNRLRRLIGSGNHYNNNDNQMTSGTPVDANLHVDEEERNNNNAHLDEEEGGNERDGTYSNNHDVDDGSVPIITEAYRVDGRSDDIIIHGHAEPLLPWYKQRRPRMLLFAIVIAFALLAIALGVPLSSKKPATNTMSLILGSEPPSQSNVPSLQPSDYPTKKPSTAPSTTNFPTKIPSDSPSASLLPTAVPSTEPSFAPSYSPSACVNKISSNAEMIDLSIDDPLGPIVAVDGKDMVVVAQQGWRGPVFIIFYALINGEWQRINIFQEDDLGDQSSVALSGTRAFVGFENANNSDGVVSIYEKDQYGDWNLMDDQFVHDANATYSGFGQHVDIDGDLACVVDGNDSAYLFRQESNKWVQFDVIIGGSGCSIAGNTIVTRSGWDSELQRYHLQLSIYNQVLDGVFPVQDRIPTGYAPSLHLSHYYLVYWDNDVQDTFVYHREEMNQTFTFLQQFNISGPQYNSGLALDNDVLVVRGSNQPYILGYGKTRIFFEQADGKWEETLTLDQDYDYYSLSGRSLIATRVSDGEVHYFNIEGCSQAMPSPTPSLSIVPSEFPSSKPSISPSLSLMPSLSSSPTETCTWIQIAITYDKFPWHTSWKLSRVVGDGWYDYELVKSHQGSRGDTSHAKSICLPDAEYIFTIDDFWGDGICCDNGGGSYNITIDGVLIVEGGDWDGWYGESTTFSIPFTMYPSMSPSPTTAPSSSSSPSMSPSLSLIPSTSLSPTSSSPTLKPSSSSSPTETCNWIQVAITYDENPDGIGWFLYRVDANGGGNKLVSSHQGSKGDTSHIEAVCLQEAKYIFNIVDFNRGTGLCCSNGEGNYKVTSNGMLIVEGGEFKDSAKSEATTFSIPFVPPS